MTFIPLHGGASGAVEMLVGIGPVLLGCVLIGFFIVLLTFDRRNDRGGWRDETPSAARLLFSGTYYDLEELLEGSGEDVERNTPESAAR